MVDGRSKIVANSKVVLILKAAYIVQCRSDKDRLTDPSDERQSETCL
ncbi:hypothetical protein VVNSV5830_02386 [Vibrio vulnificus]|nr:hypothetical protein VVORL1506_01239 [Vibrio vulnificus]OJI24254.1 hypothetical protein VVNSV5830_02386 [Vibrio vulnificus]